MPDALGRMIEDKARALIADEKQRDKNDTEHAAREAASRAAEDKRVADAKQLEWLYQKRDEEAEKRVAPWAINSLRFILIAILSVIIGGIFMPACVEPMMGRTVIAGTLFCPGARALRVTVPAACSRGIRAAAATTATCPRSSVTTAKSMSTLCGSETCRTTTIQRSFRIAYRCGQACRSISA